MESEESLNFNFCLEKSIQDKNANKASYYLLIFPLFDRVIISTQNIVRSWKISTGEFEKTIFELEDGYFDGVRVQEYRNSQKKFFLNKLIYVKRESNQGQFGYISIYSSRTLLELQRIITKDYYVINLVPLPKKSILGENCFLGSGKTENSGAMYMSPTLLGKIFIICIKTGKMIKTLEKQKTNGSRVVLSKSIPNSFYFNNYSSSGTHDILLMNYEKKIQAKKPFPCPDYMWYVRPFLNSKKQECCFAAGNSQFAFLFNTALSKTVIQKVSLSCNRPSCFEIIDDRYLVYSYASSENESKISIMDVKLVEEEKSQNQSYQPRSFEYDLKREDEKKTRVVTAMKLDVDENGNFVNFHFLLASSTYKRYKVTGLELDGLNGVAKMDLLERIDFLKNEEFNDVYFNFEKKDSLLLKIKLQNLELENIFKSFVDQ